MIKFNMSNKSYVQFDLHINRYNLYVVNWNKYVREHKLDTGKIPTLYEFNPKLKMIRFMGVQLEW